MVRYYIYTDILQKGVEGMLSDDQLVEQIRLGDEEAAEELIKRYYTSILRYCKWHCSNLEKAEDMGSSWETVMYFSRNSGEAAASSVRALEDSGELMCLRVRAV